MAAVQPNDVEDTLAPLLNPGSVAIIGASDNPARIGGRPLRYMRDAGFNGRIYPVNPNRESVQEIPAFATIAEVPEPVDTAIIAVPARAVVDTAEACAAANVKAAIIFSAGFAEMNDDGRRHQDALSAIASRTADSTAAYWPKNSVRARRPADSSSSDPVKRSSPAHTNTSCWEIRSTTCTVTRCPSNVGLPRVTSLRGLNFDVWRAWSMVLRG